MENLPSNKFFIKAFASLLLIVGYFSFFGGNNSNPSKANAEDVGRVEEKGGLLVFSKDNVTENPTAMDKLLNWGTENSEAIDSSSERGSATEESANEKTAPNILLSKDGFVADNFIKTEITDLNKTTDNSTAALKKYAEQFVQVLTPYSSPELPNDEMITLDAIQTGNSTELLKVEIMGQIHRVVTESLKSMTVPSDLSALHLNLINNTEKLAYLDSKMANALSSPNDAVEAIAAVNSHKKEIVKMVDSIVAIDNFFKNRGIDFGNKKKLNIYINDVE